MDTTPPYDHPLVDSKGKVTLPWMMWHNRVNFNIISRNVDVGGLGGYPTAPGNTTQFLRGDASFEVPQHEYLSGLQGGATNDHAHLTATQKTDLTDAGDSTLHYHAADRARANHSGTQLLATISDVTASAAQVNTLGSGLSVTITTAKITPVTGSNGSMTFTNGILTAQTQAT